VWIDRVSAPGGERRDGPGVGLTGKHPAFGDFIGLGVDPDLRRGLDRWLEAALPEAAAVLGERWADVWEASPGFGFWIGGAVLPESGGMALRGWLVPSCDRVGRRWPLLVVHHPAPPDPPPLAPDEGFAAACAAAARAARAARPETVAGLAPALAALPATQSPGEPVSPLLWAVNPALPAARLWVDLAALDYRRAAQRACYFWGEPAEGRAAAVMACPDLPEGATLAWLLAGVVAETFATPEPPPAEPPVSDADPVSNRSFDDVRD